MSGTKKCELCAKTVIIVSISVDVILMCLQDKKSHELPEDGVDKRRNMSQLKVASLRTNTC
jgi:hypothetical protein